MRWAAALTALVVLGACSASDDADEDRGERVPVRVVGADSRDGIEVFLAVDSCGRRPSVTFAEFDDRVEVAARADPPSDGDQPACGDVVTFELSQHIGTRPVVDENGRRITVRLGPMTTPSPTGSEQLLARLNTIDRACEYLETVDANSEVRRYEPIWPDTVPITQVPRPIASSNGAVVQISHHDIALFSGEPALGGPVERGECPASELWIVSGVIGVPGLYAADIAGLPTDEITAIENDGFITTPSPPERAHLDTIGELAVGHEVILGAVEVDCGLATLPFSIDGRWWTTERDQMLEARPDWPADWIATDLSWTEHGNRAPGIADHWFAGTGVPIDLIVERPTADEITVNRWPDSGANPPVRYLPAREAPSCDPRDRGGPDQS